jgi:CHAT domain-containing protein
VAAHGSVQHIELPIRRETLRSLVHRTQASIDVQSAALVGKGLTDLHRLLVSPLTPALGSARRLVIIPDRELWNVPFPGLVAGAGSEPLAARYEITFAASLRAAVRSRGPWTSPHSVLAIGSPLWDKARFSDLPLLPESAVEATRVATIYPRSRVLLGAAATRATVQRLAGGFDVIHLATHAVPNERNPGESFVLLAADQEDPGMWRASDPGWEALSGARLVVLSACRTGAERSRFGGASLGVLSSIQRSTTAQILASTGDVDDAASRRLLEAFHRRLSAGDTPAAALRLAQLDALKEPSGLTWMLYRIVV